MAPLTRFHIAVIGCGNIAAGYHGPAYRAYAAQHDGAQLAACCDLDEDKAARFRQQFGFQRHYTDFEHMLAAERPDAVCLAVPPQSTCSLACAVLQRGYPLLMEKPPGLTVDEVDRIIAAAGDTPNQVAFNRRHTPLVLALKAALAGLPPAAALQHVSYEFPRFNRTDPDFSTTAIHGLDTTRFIAGSDYAAIRFHYRPLPEFGPHVANVLMDCTFATGATAQLGFFPLAGVVVERATIHAHDHTFFLRLPIWNAYDAPGRLEHLHQGRLVLDIGGPQAARSDEDFVLNGFYGENAAFFDSLRSGRRPEGDVRNARQSVEVAQFIRERRAEYPPAG